MKYLSFLSFFILFFHATVWAHDFALPNEDGVLLYYNLISEGEVEITASPNLYNNHISIPQEIQDNGNSYLVTSIGDNAFYQCDELFSISLPESICKIGNSSFSHCSSLNYFTMPNSISAIGDNSFAYCTSLSEIILSNGLVSIGNRAFERCGLLRTFIMPNSITTIGKNAFERCSALETVSISTSLTKLEDYLFYKCSAIENIEIPSSIQCIGDYAFCECDGLHTVCLSSVSTIGRGCFKSCSNLLSVFLPNVNEISRDAFSGDYSLITVEFSAILNSIGQSAFSGCSSLLELKFPDSLVEIQSSAFSGCTSMIISTMPNNLANIGSYAFQSCYGLSFIEIPASVTEIGTGAFMDCKNLESINVDLINPYFCSIDGVLFDKEAKTLFQCPGATKSFYSIPEGVRKLDSYAFCGCSELCGIYMPQSIGIIEVHCIRYCSNLSVIRIDAIEPPTCYPASFQNAKQLTLEVPIGTKNQYESANIWKDFGNIVEFVPLISITIDSNSISAEIGTILEPQVTINPETATHPELNWSSSDESIVKVLAVGKLQCVAEGEATITVSSTDGSNVSATIKVTVTPIYVSEIITEYESMTAEIGTILEPQVTVNPLTATHPELNWSSSDESIVKVLAVGKLQ
ncbi:MAG: leucine-rich repeat protein, partial [Paludibacteraceae bacterium]|nr:leucine-rich repeat protein [Paludibacteraceae bacterium]